MVKLKFHKKLIYNLKRLIEENSGYYMHSLGINGFFVKFKGKISITGNAKKKSSVIRFGSIDLSTKKEKFEYEEDIIITKVGILGYKMFLSFK
jgi:ribosomal protein S3